MAWNKKRSGLWGEETQTAYYIFVFVSYVYVGTCVCDHLCDRSSYVRTMHLAMAVVMGPPPGPVTVHGND